MLYTCQESTAALVAWTHVLYYVPKVQMKDGQGLQVINAWKYYEKLTPVCST